MSEKKIDANIVKIKELQAEHSQVMAAMKRKENKSIDKFNELNNKALTIQNKINELRIKNDNIRSGNPPNGYSDYHDNYNFLI